MIDKTVSGLAAAVAGIGSGSTIMIGGFGRAGHPVELIEALISSRADGLTIVSNNAGGGGEGLAQLIGDGRVAKVVCSFPRQHDSWMFDRAYRSGALELELVPQGNLAERIRAAGAGIGAFYSPTGVGTPIAEGAEHRVIDGREYLIQYPIRADVALISGLAADRWGNVAYRKTSRNFGPIMATAADLTVVQVDTIVPLGDLDPESIVTPGIYVDRVVEVGVREWLKDGPLVGGVDLEGRPLARDAETEGAAR